MNSRLFVPVIAASLVLASCASPTTEATTTSEAARASTETAASSVWDSSALHTFEIDYDEADYDALMETYVTTGEKVWISATVTIDGETFENVGLKLKGNSSLRGVSADADPTDLPWIVRLDTFVDGQDLDGADEFVVRGNSSQTALNEAVALDLLDEAGLAAQEAIAVSLTIEGSEPTLRLVVENPDTDWMERELGDGYLYKAESNGDDTYRGEDPESYVDVFDQEGGEDNLTPLIDFLRFINESDDATFATELGDHLDIDAFATYLAFQELVDNDDDIDGRGNNSYLYYDIEAARMTVVNWDLNLAFGASPTAAGVTGEAGAAAGPGDGAVRGGAVAGDDAAAAPGGQRGGMAGGLGGAAGGMGGTNVLSARFLANADFAALVDAELERLTGVLYDSGVAEGSLDDWTEVLLGAATDLVPAATIEEESASLAARFPE